MARKRKTKGKSRLFLAAELGLLLIIVTFLPGSAASDLIAKGPLAPGGRIGAAVPAAPGVLIGMDDPAPLAGAAAAGGLVGAPVAGDEGTAAQPDLPGTPATATELAAAPAEELPRSVDAPVVASAAAEELAPSALFAGAVTIETRFTLPEDPRAAGFVAAIPAGLADPGAAMPTALAVVWSESEGSFFPTWSFSLHSDRGILPAGPRYRVQTSRRFGTDYVSLQAAQPKWGHTYESAFSYDPETGALSLRVQDVTTGEEVLREILAVQPAGGGFVPGAGLVAAGAGTEESAPAVDGAAAPESPAGPAPDAGLAGLAGFAAAFQPLDEITAQPVYIPRAVQWGITTYRDGRPSTTTLSRLDRDAAEVVGLRLELPGGARGTFRLYLVEVPGPALAEPASEEFGETKDKAEQAGGTPGAAPERRRLLIEAASPGDESFHPLSWDDLPPGPITLALEYEEGGRAYFEEPAFLAVGRVEAALSHLFFSQSAYQAEGILTLKGDGPFQDVGVTVRANLSQMVWDGAAGRYQELPAGSVTLFDGSLSFSTTPVEVPIAIPDPGEEPGLWRARVFVEVENQVHTVHVNNDQLFGTFRRPEPITEGPFTIAAIPDPQYYSYINARGGHPDIYVRQMAWLAERAIDERIGLTLVLGDVTDQNAPSQWAVAHQSIRLLEGVVPYVVTIGNHDMGPGGSASTRETLFNRYFTGPPKDDRLVFGGSYEEGALENSYYYVTLGGTDFLILSLEFLPRNEVLEWANAVAAAHPEHTILVITHYYTGASGLPSSSYGNYAIQNGPPGSVNSGAEVWEKFVRKHPNILMVLSGHVHHDAMPRHVRVGDHGNIVYNLLIDYQFSENGGNGWLALLRFFPDEERIGVSVYSPFLDAYKFDATDGFTVPFCIDLRSYRYVPVDEGCAVVLQEPELTILGSPMTSES